MEQKYNTWISINDELPGDGERVLIKLKDRGCWDWEVTVWNEYYNGWDGEIFTRYANNQFHNCNFITLAGRRWKQCIPYEGNEHLLGSTDNCDEYYENW